MYRNASDVEQALAVPYSGPTKEKDGFTYIPATESRRALDRLFGVLGWSESDPIISANPEAGVYAAAVRITAYVTDENGTVREVGRVGFGRSTAQATKREREEQGLTVTGNLQIHDTAAAAAGTDAFSRACKMFGPALGSDLYDGDTTSAQTAPRASYSRPAGTNGSLGPRPSEKQQAILKKAGVDWTSMTLTEWKGAVDTYFANLKKGTSVADDNPPF